MYLIFCFDIIVLPIFYKYRNIVDVNKCSSNIKFGPLKLCDINPQDEYKNIEIR